MKGLINSSSAEDQINSSIKLDLLMANTTRYKADRNGVEIMNLVLESIRNFLGLNVFNFEIGTQELDNMTSNTFFRNSEVSKFYPYTKSSDITGRGNTNKVDGVWKIRVLSRRREVLRFVLNLEVDEQDKKQEVFKCATKMYQAVDFARAFSPLLPVFTVRSNLIEVGCVDMQEHKNSTNSVITGMNNEVVNGPELKPIDAQLQYARICRLMKRLTAAHVHVVCEILRFYCEVGELWSNLYPDGNSDHEIYDIHCFIGNFAVNSAEYVRVQDPQPAPIILKGSGIADIGFDDPSNHDAHKKQPRCTVPSIFGATATKQNDKIWDFWHAKVKRMESIELKSFRDVHVQYLAVQRVNMRAAIKKHREWQNKGNVNLDKSSISSWDGIWYVEDIRQFLMFVKKITNGTQVSNFFDTLSTWGLHFETQASDKAVFKENIEENKNREENLKRRGVDAAVELALYDVLMTYPPLKYLSSTTRKAPFNTTTKNTLVNINGKFWPDNFYTDKHYWLDNGLGYTVMSLVDEMENALFSMWRENIADVDTGELISWHRKSTPAISMITILNVLKRVNSRSSITVRKHHHFEANSSFERNNDNELLSIKNTNVISGKKKSSKTLFSMCLHSISNNTPKLDDKMSEYIESFQIPDAAVFFRMIRCTNLYALQQLQHEMDRNEDFKKKIDSVLGEFSIGIQLEINTLIMLAEHDDELLMYMTFETDSLDTGEDLYTNLPKTVRVCDMWNNCFQFVSNLQKKMSAFITPENGNDDGFRVLPRQCLKNIADSGLAHKLRNHTAMWRILMGVQPVDFLTLYEKLRGGDYRSLNSFKTKQVVMDIFSRQPDIRNPYFKDIRDLQPWVVVALACRLGVLLAQEVVLQTSLLGVKNELDVIEYKDDIFQRCKCKIRDPPDIKKKTTPGGTFAIESIEKGPLRMLPICMPGNRGGGSRNDKEKAVVYCRVFKYNPLKWTKIENAKLADYDLDNQPKVRGKNIEKRLGSKLNSAEDEINLSVEDYLEIWDEDDEIGPHKFWERDTDKRIFFRMDTSSWTLVMDVYSLNHVLISKMVYKIDGSDMHDKDTFIDDFVRISPSLLGVINIFSTDGDSFKFSSVDLCTRTVSVQRKLFKDDGSDFTHSEYHITMGESYPDVFVFKDDRILRFRVPVDESPSKIPDLRVYNMVNYDHDDVIYHATIACDRFVVTVSKVDKRVYEFELPTTSYSSSVTSSSEFTDIAEETKTLYNIHFYDLMREEIGSTGLDPAKTYLYNIHDLELLIPHPPISIRMLGSMTLKDVASGVTYNVLCLQIICADTIRARKERHNFLRYVFEFSLPNGFNGVSKKEYKYRLLSIHRVAKVDQEVEYSDTIREPPETIYHEDHCVVDDDTIHVHNGSDSIGARTMQLKNYSLADVMDLQTLRGRSTSEKARNQIIAETEFWICCGVTRPSLEAESEFKLNNTNALHMILDEEFKKRLLDIGSKDTCVCKLSSTARRVFDGITITFDQYIVDTRNFHWMPLQIDDSNAVYIDKFRPPFTDPGPHLTSDTGIIYSDAINRAIYQGSHIESSVKVAFSMVKPQALLMPVLGKHNFQPDSGYEYVLCSIRHSASEISDDATKGYGFTTFPHGMRDHEIILGPRHIMSLNDFNADNSDHEESDNKQDTAIQYELHAEWQACEIAHLSSSEDALVSNSQNLAHEGLEMWSVAVTSCLSLGSSTLVRSDSDSFKLLPTKCGFQPGLRGNASLGSFLYYTTDVLEEVDGFDNQYTKKSIARWSGHTDHSLSKPMRTVVTAFPTPWTVAAGEFWRLRNFQRFLLSLWCDYCLVQRMTGFPHDKRKEFEIEQPYDFSLRRDSEEIQRFERNQPNYQKLCIDAAIRDTKCLDLVDKWSQLFKVYHTANLPSEEQMKEIKEKKWHKNITEEQDPLRLGIHQCTVRQVRTIFWNIIFRRTLINEETLSVPEYGVVWRLRGGESEEEERKAPDAMQKRVEEELKKNPKADSFVIAHNNRDLPLRIKDSNTTCSISDRYYISDKTDHFFITARESLFDLLLLHSIKRTKKALLWKRTAIGILLRWRLLQAQSAFSCSGLAGKLYPSQRSVTIGRDMYVNPVQMNAHFDEDQTNDSVSLGHEFFDFVSKNRPNELLKQSDKMAEFKLSLQKLNNIFQYMMNDFISSESNFMLMQCASDVNLPNLKGLKWRQIASVDGMNKSIEWERFIHDMETPETLEVINSLDDQKTQTYMYMSSSEVYDQLRLGKLEVPNKKTYFVHTEAEFFTPAETNSRDHLYRFPRSNLDFLSCNNLSAFIDATRLDQVGDAELLGMGISMTRCDI